MNTATETPSLDAGLLLECVVTTRGPAGVNVAPMGPIVDPAMTRVLLRPYRSSTTYQNLRSGSPAVLHVTDDVELIAHTALDALSDPPATRTSPSGGAILTGACRWYDLRVESIDDGRERTEIVCRVDERGRLRDFVGFNRAMHAVIEATILATRLEWLDRLEVREQIDRLAIAVRKTGGPRERRAFAFVQNHIAEHGIAERVEHDAARD